MISLNKNKFFTRYLPMFLSVVLIVSATFAYLIFGQGTKVAEAAVTQVQSTAGVANGSAAAASTQFSSINTAGDTIIAAVRWAGTGSITSVTDTAGNLYTISAPTLATIPATHYANLYTEMVYATGIKAQANNVVTVNFNAVVIGSVSLAEITPSVLDLTASNTGNSANPSAGSVTTASSVTMLFPKALLMMGLVLEVDGLMQEADGHL